MIWLTTSSDKLSAYEQPRLGTLKSSRDTHGYDMQIAKMPGTFGKPFTISNQNSILQRYTFDEQLKNVRCTSRFPYNLCAAKLDSPRILSQDPHGHETKVPCSLGNSSKCQSFALNMNAKTIVTFVVNCKEICVDQDVSIWLHRPVFRMFWTMHYIESKSRKGCNTLHLQ